MTIRSGVVLVLAAAVFALTGTRAQASFIAFRCGANLCEVNPNGSGQKQLTQNGRGPRAYGSPSLSLDGSELAFTFRHNGYVMHAGRRARTRLNAGRVLRIFISPDGQRVAVINQQQVPWIATLNADGSGYADITRQVATAGWLDTTLLRDGFSRTPQACAPGSSCAAFSICPVQLGGACAGNVADDPLRDLSDPAGSPDGKLLAVTATPYSAPAGHRSIGGGAIALYDPATGAHVRDLTSGPGDSRPAWSPDGSMIAFSRAGAIYVEPADGGPGSERYLVAGDSPTWGGGRRTLRRDRIDQLVAATKLAYAQETRSALVDAQLRRIARDRVLLAALERGNWKRARAETTRQLNSAINHHAHVTRIAVIRGSRVLVDRVAAPHGAVSGRRSFVVAPATRELRGRRGRNLGRLKVSIQDVIGFVRLMHRTTQAQFVVRGRNGRERRSLPAAAGVALPLAGRVRIARRHYIVRSFREPGWGGESLTIWVLKRA